MAGADPLADMSGPHGGRPIVTAGAPRSATAAVLLAFHGRGATAQGVVNLLSPAVPRGVAVVAPSAERSRWLPREASAPIDRNEPHASSALAVADALLADTTERFDVARDHIVLAGFSQGACVAAEYAARNPGPFGTVLLSGTLLGPEISADRYAGSFDGAPTFVGCGADDGRVDPERVRQTAAVFRSLGADVTERVYEGVGHEVTDDEFDYLSGLLSTLTEK